jgi:hypothetical protein
LRRAGPALAFVLALGLVAGGCGSGSDSSANDATATTQPAPVGPPRVQFPAGRWQGRLAQRGLKPFQVRVVIRSKSRPQANRVSYTGIECGGNWTWLGHRGPDLRFREVINRGRGGSCKGTGVVALRYVAADRLRYEFRGGGVSSSGFLRPVD